MWLTRNRACAFVGVATAAAAAMTNAATINVPLDQPTIQAGIDAASDGDEVVVAVGEYFENIDLMGKAITVRSTNPDDPQAVADTIINGGGAGPVVTCATGEGPLTILDGLTITNGAGPTGAGIRIVSASPIVRRCVISANTSVDWDHLVQGGGMYVADGSPVVDLCTFSANNAWGDPGKGGAIYHQGGSLTVISCTFVDNQAEGDDTGLGGAICSTGGTAIATSCDFTDNFSAGGCTGYGGAVYGEGGTLELSGCSFTGNGAGAGSCGGGGVSLGGAVYGGDTVSMCVFEANAAENGGAIVGVPSVHDCVFVDNQAVGDDESCGIGGAILGADLVLNCSFIGNHTAPCGVDSGGGAIHHAPRVINCMFVTNRSWDGAGIYDAGMVINSTFVDNGYIGCDGGGIKFADAIINCIFRGNTADQIYDCPDVTYSNVEGGWLGRGNIDADPLFDADYHLLSGSPSIDAGRNWAIAGQADTDLAGAPRFADDPATADTGCGVPVIVDMGAYEYQGDPFPVRLGDLDGDGAVGVVDFLMLLADWGPCAEPCCLADLDLDGTVGVNDFLALLAGWG